MINLMQGDCLERMKEIPDGSVDMILTDPPYGTTACKWDSIIPLEPMWKELKRIIKADGAILLFGAEPFSSALRNSNIENYKYDWVWIKEQGTGFASSKKQPLRKHEIISVFYAKPPFYNSKGKKLDKPRIIKRKANSNNKSITARFSGSGLQDRISVYTHTTKHSILEFNRERGKHPTQKPVPLIEYLINTYTKENQTVFDFTMGSGSTGVACVNTNRNFIGIELDTDYFDIAQQRIQEAKNELS
jgi:DNA modification methylase